MNGMKMILILVLTLMIVVATRAEAQTKTKTTTTTTEATTTSAPAAAPATTTESDMSSRDVRNELSALLRNHPPELGSILSLDPTLLSDEAFLAHYPDLAQFIAAHPEVRHQTAFYLDSFDPERERSHTIDKILEPIFTTGAIALVLFGVAWVIRTIVEQKRWSRLARTQSEVHNKILDRFGTSTELLEYIKTTAGSRFLESAPIPLHSAEPSRMSAPVARVLASVQFGVIISAAAAGVLFVSGRFTKDAADGLYALGMIALCIGLGFIASAVISLVLARRLTGRNDTHALAAANQ